MRPFTQRFPTPDQPEKLQIDCGSGRLRASHRNRSHKGDPVFGVQNVVIAWVSDWV